MALTADQFAGCTVKDLYDSMLYSATKMDYYLDLMHNNAINSGKYIDAKVWMLEWERCYDAASAALESTYGWATRDQVVDMINKDLALIAQRRKIFG
jgi:hypothetical protein